MMLKRVIFSLFFFSFFLVGCSTADPSSITPVSNAYIQNKGSDTMVNLALAWAETYQKIHPEVRISVTGGGSGTGISSLLNGTVDIANASRAIKPEELEEARSQGFEPYEYVVAQDAIAVIVNLQNPINELTLEQISAIYRGEYTNWSELGGEDRPIVRLSRETNSGTHVYFLETVVRLGNSKDKSLFTPETLLLPSSEGIISEVRDNPNAIGYDGLGYVTDEVKTLAIAPNPGETPILPSVESVNDGTYPISRELFIYTHGEPSTIIKAYLDWILSTEAQDIVLSLGFVPVKVNPMKPTQGVRKIKWSEWLITQFIRVAGYLSILYVSLIILFLLKEGLPALKNVSPASLFGEFWYPIEGHFSIWPLLFGSITVTIGAALIAIPLGVGTAVFISEIAPAWAKEILKPLVEILAGMPSVVLGFIGILVLSPFLREALNLPTGLTAFTGALLLGWSAIPTIVSVAEDALNTVPRGYREGARALGTTSWQTIWGVTVPAARSGIITAVMLGIGRVIGETMAVMMVTGNAPVLPHGLNAFFLPIRTMTATIASEMGEVAQGSVHYQVLFLIGIILFLLSLVINIVAFAVSARRMKRTERLLS